MTKVQKHSFCDPKLLKQLIEIRKWEDGLSRKDSKKYQSEKKRLYNMALHQESGPYSIGKQWQFGLVLRTRSRNSVIIPEIVGKVFLVHNGKGFQVILIGPDMVNRKFGEFVQTRISRYKKAKRGNKGSKS